MYELPLSIFCVSSLDLFITGAHKFAMIYFDPYNFGVQLSLQEINGHHHHRISSISLRQLLNNSHPLGSPALGSPVVDTISSCSGSASATSCPGPAFGSPPGTASGGAVAPSGASSGSSGAASSVGTIRTSML